MSSFAPLAGGKPDIPHNPKPTLLIPMYGPAVRCKRTSSSWRTCGLASMYLAFDWSLLRSGKIKMLFPDARVRGD